MKVSLQKIVFLFLLSTLLPLSVLQAKEFQKIHLRSGINNFYSKLESNDSISIVYFGGSITNAPGWRIKSFEWLKQQYPKSEFIQVNAAIGGTGSNLGAFRFQNDVLKHKPDLILMEFAVNDSRTNKASIMRQYEGIIRKLWNALPNTDICFIYTLKDEFADAYNSGELPYTIVSAEEIAEYYGIPTLNFGVEIMNRVNNEELIFRGEKPESNGIPCFSKDGVHPFTETGHQYYFEDFKTFQTKLSKQKNKKLKRHKLPKALFNDNWEEARYLSFSKIKFTGDWEVPNSKNQLYETDSPDASLSFEFEGSMFGIYDWIGPSGTSIVINIDGVSQEKMRFDKHCSYNRANYFFIQDLKPGKHKIEIKMGRILSADEKVKIIKERLSYAEDLKPKLTNNRFRLAKVMVL